MDFRNPKLAMSASMELIRMPLHKVEAYVPLLSPIYGFFKRNQRFICVKGPLDFFVPSDLEKIQSLGTLFVLPFVDTLKPFVDSARTLKRLIHWKPRGGVNSTNRNLAVVQIEPSPFEVSDGILRILGPLWTKSGVIETFFIHCFVQELLGPMDSNDLVAAKELGVDKYEKALVSSSISVFLALLLGIYKTEYLVTLRNASFSKVYRVDVPSHMTSQCLEIMQISEAIFDQHKFGKMTFMSLSKMDCVTARKLEFRLGRINRSFKSKSNEIATIFGPKGFKDE